MKIEIDFTGTPKEKISRIGISKVLRELSRIYSTGGPVAIAGAHLEDVTFSSDGDEELFSVLHSKDPRNRSKRSPRK